MNSKIVSLLTYCYIILLPLLPNKFSIGYIPFNGDVILGILLIFYSINVVLCKKNRRKFVINMQDFITSYFSIFASILFVLMLLSISYAGYKKAALSESLRFFTYIFLYFIIKYEASDKKIVNNILNSFIFISITLCIIGIFQYFTRIGIEEFIYIEKLSTSVRIPSTLGNPNSFGGFLILSVFPIMLLALNEKQKKMKLFYSLSFVLIFINILLTQSRNAWLGFLVGAVILVLIYNIKLLFIFFFLGGVPFFIPQLFTRFKELSNIMQNEGRIQLWKLAYKMIKDQPIFGIGNGNYFKLYKDYILKYPELNYNHHTEFTVHNIYLKVQSELGIFGTMGFIGIIITAIIRLKNITNESIDIKYIAFFKGFLASFVAFVFMNLSDDFFVVPKIVAYFWILFATSEAIQYRVTEYRS